MDMGIRELRAGLSRWLDPTGAGEELIITDRGAPVANLNPIDQRHSFDRLVAAGLVTPLAHEPHADVPKRRAPPTW